MYYRFVLKKQFDDWCDRNNLSRNSSASIFAKIFIFNQSVNFRLVKGDSHFKILQIEKGGIQNRVTKDLKKIIYIFYSTTRIGREFPFSQPTGPKYYVLLPEIIVPENQTQKSWENQLNLGLFFRKYYFRFNS